MLDTIRNKLDDRGVSPVIGVILMVAITVILAAVIGSFVLGIGGDVEQTPQASLSIETPDDGNVSIAHEGGDTLDTDDIRVTIDGNDADQQLDEAGGTFESGDSVTLDNSSNKFNDGDTIRVIHEPSGGLIAQADADV